MSPLFSGNGGNNGTIRHPRRANDISQGAIHFGFCGSESSVGIVLPIPRCMGQSPGNTMSARPPTATGGDAPQGLHTAEEVADALKVDPKTVLNWAKSGIIPEACRVGRTVRFSLDAVNASLDVNRAGAGRRVELVVLALRYALGPEYPRVPALDAGGITMDEGAEVRRLHAVYAADLETLKTPEERYGYARGIVDAAELLARIG